VDGQILRREVEEIGRLEIYYDLLNGELEKLNNIIYSHHDKTQEDINTMILKTNEIEKVLDELWKKLNILQLFKDIEKGEQEENQDFELEENGSFTTLKIIITYKKFIHKKGGLSGNYRELEVLEKFVIETKKLPENFIFLYREQNMGIQNFYDMYERITTKYYIVLEGDDFWCDDISTC
jgi:hypothetical protein